MQPFRDQQFIMTPHWLSTVGSHHVRVRLWDRAFELFVDQEPLPGNLPFGLDPAGGLCIGEPQGYEIVSSRVEPAAGFRISNARVRRLDVPQPPPKTASPDQERSYWEQRIQLDDQDDFAQLQLAGLLYLQQKYDEAAEHARRALAIHPLIKNAHSLIGCAAYHNGRDREALDEFQLAEKEGSIRIEDQIHWAEILAASSDESLRNGHQAKIILTTIEQSLPMERATYLPVLAAMHAELGEFDKALQINQQAIEISQESNKPHLKQRQKLYQAYQPYRREK